MVDRAQQQIPFCNRNIEIRCNLKQPLPQPLIVPFSADQGGLLHGVGELVVPDESGTDPP